MNLIPGLSGAELTMIFYMLFVSMFSLVEAAPLLSQAAQDVLKYPPMSMIPANVNIKGNKKAANKNPISMMQLKASVRNKDKVGVGRE